jgi:hypothetical protein
MGDDRNPFRHVSLGIRLLPLHGARSVWAGTYGDHTTRPFDVRWHRSEFEDAGAYEVRVHRDGATYSVLGEEHADDETAWAQLMDALRRTEWLYREVTHAELEAERERRAESNRREHGEEGVVW